MASEWFDLESDEVNCILHTHPEDLANIYRKYENEYMFYVDKQLDINELNERYFKALNRLAKFV